MIGDRPIRIEVDGGINPETAALVAAAGADTLVAGSGVFKGGPDQYAANIAAIRAGAAGKFDAMPLEALIFDVDGTLAETEELHRQAFNETFRAFGLDWVWPRELYRELLDVTGGRERILHYIDRHAPAGGAGVRAKAREMHAEKTARYVNACARRRARPAPRRQAADRRGA